jgi:Fe-coproporphyrin III synthase
MLSPGEVYKRQVTLATHRIHTLPVVVLMPHSRCNCRCVMCDIWKANRHSREISRHDLARHIAAFRELNVQWVVLSGGEALMHSNLWALCDLLKDVDVKISLLSTGLLLKRYASDIISSCDDVIVSLDGNRDVHNAIRGIRHAYERLEEGVAALKAMEPNFRVTARCVIQRANYVDLLNIISAAHTLGIDQISFLSVDVSTAAFNRPRRWGDERVSEVALSPNEACEFEQIVDEAIRRYADDFTSGFIAEPPQKLRRLPRYFHALNNQGDFPETVCNAPWVSTVIEADGTVRPCFFHRSLGNIHRQSLEEILNSAEAVAFRRNLDVKRDEICRKCVCTLHVDPRNAI